MAVLTVLVQLIQVTKGESLMLGSTALLGGVLLVLLIGIVILLSRR